jgi:hypothetical protein
MLLLLVTPAGATIYFNPVPNPLVQGNPGDTCATNPAACARSADVNADFNKLVVDGNAAKAAIQSQLSGVTAAGVPSGAVIMINNVVCPFGWVAADGIGGSPDIRGVYVRGLDKGAGRDPGRALGTYQADAIEDHGHTAPSIVSSANFGPSLVDGSSIVYSGVAGAAGVTEVQADTAPTPDTRPRSVILLYCYKK